MATPNTINPSLNVYARPSAQPSSIPAKGVLVLCSGKERCLFQVTDRAKQRELDKIGPLWERMKEFAEMEARLRYGANAQCWDLRISLNGSRTVTYRAGAGDKVHVLGKKLGTDGLEERRKEYKEYGESEKFTETQIEAIDNVKTLSELSELQRAHWVNNELKSVRDRVTEIEGKQPLSPEDQKELKQLQAEEEALEKRLTRTFDLERAELFGDLENIVKVAANEFYRPFGMPDEAVGVPGLGVPFARTEAMQRGYNSYIGGRSWVNLLDAKGLTTVDRWVLEEGGALRVYTKQQQGDEGKIGPAVERVSELLKGLRTKISAIGHSADPNTLSSMNQLLAQLADENIQYDALLGAVGVNAAFSGKSEEDRARLICEWMIKRLDGGKDRMDLTYRRIFAEQAGDLVFLDHADLAAHINRDDPNQASHSMTAPCIERLIYHLCSVERKQDDSEEKEVVKKALRSMGQGYESVDALVSEIVSLRKTM
ncbi:MAG: hypothetical protein KGI80_03950 [Verrucomicrobiota bacterium]|nr:hypothetical protein [Verrucomicrobiota bacterium]